MAISSFQATAFCGSLIRKIKLGFVSGQSFMRFLYPSENSSNLLKVRVSGDKNRLTVAKY
jgi:hypothetical protein